MKYLKTIICLLLVQASVIAQEPVLNFSQLVPDNNLIIGSDFMSNAPEAVEGSPLLFKEWQPGYVQLKDGAKIDKIEINLLNQDAQLVIKQLYEGVEVMYNVDESVIDFFMVHDQINGISKKYKYLAPDKFDGSVANWGFYEVLGDNETTSIVKYSSKVFYEAEKGQGYSANKTSKYVLRERYFLKAKNNNYTEIRLKRKSIEKALGPELANKAKQVTKNNNLSWSKEEDLSRLLELINS